MAIDRTGAGGCSWPSPRGRRRARHDACWRWRRARRGCRRAGAACRCSASSSDGGSPARRVRLAAPARQPHGGADGGLRRWPCWSACWSIADARAALPVSRGRATRWPSPSSSTCCSRSRPAGWRSGGARWSWPRGYAIRARARSSRCCCSTPAWRPGLRGLPGEPPARRRAGRARRGRPGRAGRGRRRARARGGRPVVRRRARARRAERRALAPLAARRGGGARARRRRRSPRRRRPRPRRPAGGPARVHRGVRRAARGVPRRAACAAGSSAAPP